MGGGNELGERSDTCDVRRTSRPIPGLVWKSNVLEERGVVIPEEPTLATVLAVTCDELTSMKEPPSGS